MESAEGKGNSSFISPSIIPRRTKQRKVNTISYDPREKRTSLQSKNHFPIIEMQEKANIQPSGLIISQQNHKLSMQLAKEKGKCNHTTLSPIQKPLIYTGNHYTLSRNRIFTKQYKTIDANQRYNSNNQSAFYKMMPSCKNSIHTHLTNKPYGLSSSSNDAQYQHLKTSPRNIVKNTLHYQLNACLRDDTNQSKGNSPQRMIQQTPLYSSKVIHFAPLKNPLHKKSLSPDIFKHYQNTNASDFSFQNDIPSHNTYDRYKDRFRICSLKDDIPISIDNTLENERSFREDNSINKNQSKISTILQNGLKTSSSDMHLTQETFGSNSFWHKILQSGKKTFKYKSRIQTAQREARKKDMIRRDINNSLILPKYSEDKRPPSSNLLSRTRTDWFLEGCYLLKNGILPKSDLSNRIKTEKNTRSSYHRSENQEYLHKDNNNLAQSADKSTIQKDRFPQGSNFISLSQNKNESSFIRKRPARIFHPQKQSMRRPSIKLSHFDEDNKSETSYGIDNYVNEQRHEL